VRVCVNSAVGIANGYGLDGRGVGVRASVGATYFSYLRRPDRFWEPPCFLSNVYRGSFSEVKRPRREADHATPSSAKANNMWMYTSTLPYAFIS
jgi:hypothetical protein